MYGVCRVDHLVLQMWSPPTPPHDDNDVYMDQTLLFLYEPSIMPEAQLPPVYVKKERKKIKVESITSKSGISHLLCLNV